ncbi:hypothetical protein C2845_PM14G07240 [Panicum miliaceum]|uniref:Protein FAR1-RELATED SEQUENCE n=1 Tax=Panicum miliaceum TaxID=4540 RepID=A0A3L6PQ88_PANMI|nr:hypothetical protein C2845_PM14G07240 [Panicum miliaceum]
MAKAIKKELPNTRHRWCRWHVLKNAKDKLGAVYSKRKAFKCEFNDLITDEICIERFEAQWVKVVGKYRLKKNKFLKRLYKHRQKWAKPYFMTTFCAGMTSTQHSESANHMLKPFIQRAAPMHRFVSKFNEFQSDRRDEEGREKHVTKMVRRQLRVGVPIEEHAKEVYTRGMYENFYDELFESGKYAIHAIEDGWKYVLVKNKDKSLIDPKMVTVAYKSDDDISCECGLFEHMGMLCRHIIKVLVLLDKSELPPKYVKKRWTKQAAQCHVENEVTCIGGEHAESLLKKVLLTKTIEVISGKASVTESGILHAIQALPTSAETSQAASEIQAPQQIEDVSNIGVMPIACPPRTVKGGRPPNTGLKSWLSGQKKKKKKQDLIERKSV